MSDNFVCLSTYTPKILQTQAISSLSRRVVPGMLGWTITTYFSRTASTRSARFSGPSFAVSMSAPRFAHVNPLKIRSTIRRHR